jgi:hypothetical protein
MAQSPDDSPTAHLGSAPAPEPVGRANNNGAHRLTTDRRLAEMRRAALDEAAAGRGRAQRHPIELGPGRRVARSPFGSTYEYPAHATARLDELALLRCGAAEYAARVIASPHRARPPETITLAVTADFGEAAPAGQLVLDTAWISERLARHLEQLPDEFNDALAWAVIGERPLPPTTQRALPTFAALDALNADQQEAVRLSLASAAAMVVGPPGTGKTTTLAATAAAHYYLGHRVLVVAPSNAAADVAALAVAELLEHAPRFERGLVLRLGARPGRALRERFGAQVEYERVLDRLAGPDATPQRVADLAATLLAECGVVVTTLHTMFLSRRVPRTFDTVLIDEAGMVPLALAFAAAGRAESYVTCFGDPHQLGPVVTATTRAASDWLGRDVFHARGVSAALAAGDPAPDVVLLREQHRMAPRICGLVSEQFYGGLLVSHPSLRRREWPGDSGYWGAITCLDTSRAGAHTTFGDDGRLNQCHLDIIALLLDDFIEAGDVVPGRRGATSVAVLAPYRGQAARIRQLVRARDLTRAVRTGTVHAIQGQEADSVVLDLTDARGARLSPFFRSAAAEHATARLLGVAASRARHRLFVVCDVEFLARTAPPDGVLRRFLAGLEEHGTIVDAAAFMAPAAA